MNSNKNNSNYSDFIDASSNRICVLVREHASPPPNPYGTDTNSVVQKNISLLLDDVKNVIDVLNDNDIKLLNYSKIGFDGFSKISNVIAPDDYTDRDIIVKNIAITDKDELDKGIAERIKPIVAVPEYIPKMIKIGCLAGVNNWNETIAKINESFQQNNGNLINIVNIQLVVALQYINLSNENTEKIKEILKSGYFWNYVNSLTSQVDMVLNASFLLGKYVDKLDIPNIANLSGYKIIKNIWKEKSPENAEYIFDMASKTQNYEFIWELANDKENLLVGDIIEIALEKKAQSFFAYKDSFINFSNAFNFIPEKNHQTLLDYFIEYGDLFSNMINDTNFRLIDFPEVLPLVLEKDKNEQNKIVTRIKSEIETIEKNEWHDIFRNNSSILDIMLSITSNKQLLKLENDYCNAFSEYVISLIKENINTPPFDREKLKQLFEIMSEAFQDDFGKKIARSIIDFSFAIPDILKEFVCDSFFPKELFDNKKSDFFERIKECIEERKITEISFVVKLLKNRDREKKLFKTEKKYTELIKNPLENLMKENSEIDTKESIQYLASIFNIKFDIDRNNSE